MPTHGLGPTVPRPAARAGAARRGGGAGLGATAVLLGARTGRMEAATDALVDAVLPWAVGVFYFSLFVLFALHFKIGAVRAKTKHFTEEPRYSWANGYVKLGRWILGVVMGGSAGCAGIVWALMDEKRFRTAGLLPENVSDATQALVVDLEMKENGCVGPPGVCSFGWSVVLPIGLLFALFHAHMLIARVRGQQLGNTASLLLCGACQLLWMSLVFLWKRALQIDADSDRPLVLIDIFTDVSTAIILLTWLIRASYMFKYGLLSS